MNKVMIKFNKDDKPYEIKAYNKRYLICVRDYTVEEAKREIETWNDGLEEWLLSEYELSDKKESYLDFYEDNYNELYPHYIDEYGQQPEGISEDTFYYTIVDLVDKVRVPDNYYCKHNYQDKEECELALRELETITEYSKNNSYKEYELEISRRNRISLDIDEVELNKILRELGI